MARPIPLPAPVTRATREPSGVIDALLSLAHYNEGAGRIRPAPLLLPQRSNRGSPHVAVESSTISASRGSFTSRVPSMRSPERIVATPPLKEGGEHHVLPAQVEERG